MQIHPVFPWINLMILLSSLPLFAILYIFSLMPATLTEKRGPSAWKLCKYLRSMGTFFMVIALINMILWFWIPVPNLDWPINPNPWIGIILGGIILMVSLPIWIKGLHDAGSECHEPSEESKIFGGIYKHIRHPQTLGEISWLIAFPLLVNALFLLSLSIIFLLIYTPIMIYIEEQDLVTRFGKDYLEYRKRTGAFFPKLKKSRNSKYRSEKV